MELEERRQEAEQKKEDRKFVEFLKMETQQRILTEKLQIEEEQRKLADGKTNTKNL